MPGYAFWQRSRLCFLSEVVSNDNSALSTRRVSEFDSPRGRVLSSRSAEVEGCAVRIVITNEHVIYHFHPSS
jgi:hypothetical protein